MVKYRFYVDVEDGSGGVNRVEWVNLTERTAKMMYNATANSCRTNELKRYGYGEMK